MRAMKASDAVGRRCRVKWTPLFNEDPPEDVEIDDTGVCSVVHPDWDWPVQLDMDKSGCCEFMWCELELAEDDE